MVPIIQLINISRNYNSVKAVKHISFNVQKGEVFGILGPNGAGKTTIISMMITLLKPSSGKIFIKSKDIAYYGKEVRKFVGVVFQESLLDEDLTIRENLDIHALLYISNNKLRAKRIFNVMKLTNILSHKNKKVEELSGGLKKRLEFARGLLNNPEILFLDEPTLGLDPIAKNNIWNYIKHLQKKEKKTIMLTTNNMEEAEKLCDKIMIINKGIKIWSGTMRDMKRKGKTLERAFIKIVQNE